MSPKGSSTKRKAKAVAAGSGDESDGYTAPPVSTNNKQKKGQDASDDEDDKDSKPSAAKKSKKAPKEPVKPLDPNIPINTTFPIEVSFEAKKAGTTRLSCWNGELLASLLVNLVH